MDLVRGEDGRLRCAWGASAPDYVAYHDAEWGIPVRTDERLYERLTLEGFQSGLSWITILRKRDRFRSAFHGFDPRRVAAFGDEDIARLLADAGIVRHRGKIEAAIGNARALLAWQAQEGMGCLGRLVWSFATAGSRPRSVADVPSTTPASTALSTALRARGFRFVGPTTAYAAMQACGVVNDHLVGCEAPSAGGTGC